MKNICNVLLSVTLAFSPPVFAQATPSKQGLNPGESLIKDPIENPVKDQVYTFSVGDGILCDCKAEGPVIQDGVPMTKWKALKLYLEGEGSSSDNTAPAPDAGGNAAASAVPSDSSDLPPAENSGGSGSPSSIAGSAVAAGAGAALSYGVQQGIHHYIILPKERQASIAATQNEINQMAAGVDDLRQQGALDLSQGTDKISGLLGQTLPGNTKQVAMAPQKGVEDGNLFLSQDPDFLKRAEVVNQKLKARAHTPVQATAKTIGKAALQGADEASAEGDSEGAETQLKVADTMADLLFGLDPYTGFARDTFEFFSGLNPITMEELAPWERAFSGVGMALSLFSFGLASSAKNALKASLKSVAYLKAPLTSLPAFTKARKFFDQIAKFPWGVRLTKNPNRGVNLVDQASKHIIEFLGPGATARLNNAGDLVLLSADGNRRVRFDFKNPGDHFSPHSHVEVRKPNGKWWKSGQIYPPDVPKR